jgi:hypothetical protein
MAPRYLAIGHTKEGTIAPAFLDVYGAQEKTSLNRNIS